MLSPEDGLVRRNRLPCPLLISHTPPLHYQPHSLERQCGRTHINTRTQASTGLKAQTVLLAKGQCQESEKSFFGESETSHIQLKWKHTSSCFALMFPFLHFLFISLLVFLSRSIVLRRDLGRHPFMSGSVSCWMGQCGKLEHLRKTNARCEVRRLCWCCLMEKH